ncbi:MAG: NPCBM/NEW2 domain-containing protein [Thermoguttaceae bacterium]|nr:NPCBM/NEW2 domain-containing protein [Thermoguttaceae bacterium]
MVFDVTFDRWDPQSDQMFFKQQGNSFQIEFSSFLCWGAPAEFSLTDFTLVLTDGSAWAGEAPKMKNGQDSKAQDSEVIEWETINLGALDFPLDDAAGILFPGVPTGTQERFLTELREAHFEEDVLIFKTGERIFGEFLTFEENTVTFQTRELASGVSEELLPELRQMHVAMDQLAALFFSGTLHLKSKPAPAAQKFFWFGLADGSLIRFQTNENRFNFQEIPPDQIVYVESPQKSQKFFNESLTSAAEKIEERCWLDELKPAEAKTRGREIWPSWKAGAEPDGKRLHSSGKIWRHGLGMTAGTSLKWNLEGDFRHFGVLPVLADSDRALAVPRVRCRILVDGKTAAEQILEPDSGPELVLVKVENAKELVLETTNLSETGKPVPGGAAVNWLNVFLSP